MQVAAIALRGHSAKGLMPLIIVELILVSITVGWALTDFWWLVYQRMNAARSLQVASEFVPPLHALGMQVRHTNNKYGLPSMDAAGGPVGVLSCACSFQL
jgi:hypothetical protein